MGLIAFLVRASRGAILLSTLAGLTAGITGVGLIAMIQRELAGSDGPTLGESRAWAFFAGLCALAAILRVVAQLAMIRLAQGAVAGLGVHLVRRTLGLPLRDFEAIDASALLAALTEDIAILAGSLVGLPHLCINIPIVFACFAYVGWLSPPVFLAGLVFAAAAIGAYVAISTSGVRGLRRARTRQDAVVGHFRTAIGGFRELKQHGGRRGAFLDGSLAPDVASARDETIAALGRFAIADGWSQLAFFGFIGFLLFGLPTLSTIDRPTQVSTVLIVLYLMSPLDVILNWVPVLSRARASLAKIEAMLPEIERLSEDVARPMAGWDPETIESVVLDGASFHYEDPSGGAGFALGPLELSLRRGEIVVLAGGNGSGKTTLVKVLSGLYRPDSGLVRVDGRPVSDAEAEAYRQLFTVVFADGHLFDDLRGVGHEPIDDRARAGLERLGLSHRVAVEAGRFSTLDLSQGQRRRLALLSAWLEDRPFCILDEWAANQDPAFKQIFYARLLPEMRAAGKGLLVISHDEDYFDAADRVIHLSDGRVRDESPSGVGGVWT